MMRRKTSPQTVIGIEVGQVQHHGISPETEARFMQRIAAGDREAFSTVVEMYMADVFRLSYSILRDQAMAEDMAQETFSRLWTKAAQWNPSGRIKSWLLRIAHNLCIDEIRGRKDYHPDDVSEMAIPDSAPSALELYAKRQSGDIVSGALLSLPERQRTALTLVYYQEHSNIEAAAIMGITVDALESLVARGRQNMKELLKAAKPYLLES